MKKTVRKLRLELCEIFDKLRAGKMTSGEAKEMTNTAGKIISTAKLELQYAELCERQPSIPFLNDDLDA